jgi:hypothetical protein
MQTDDLVAPPSCYHLERGTPEYEAAKAAEIAYWIPRMQAAAARDLAKREADRLAKANAVRLVMRRELSLAGECEHIEQRTAALIEREQGLQGRAYLMEVRRLAEWHARQAQLHAQAAGWAQAWGRR